MEIRREHLVQSVAVRSKDNDPHPAVRKLAFREMMGMEKVAVPSLAGRAETTGSGYKVKRCAHGKGAFLTTPKKSLFHTEI